MQWTTHIAGGAVAAGVIITAYMNHDFALGSEPVALIPGVFALAVVGALTPDIDLKTSKMGQQARTMSVVINFLFGHRTLFHAPILYLLLYMVLKEPLHQCHILMLAFTAGAFSHIVLDMLNVKGIPLFYPVKGNYHIASIQNGGLAEKTVFITLIVISAIIELRHIVLAFSNAG